MKLVEFIRTDMDKTVVHVNPEKIEFVMYNVYQKDETILQFKDHSFPVKGDVTTVVQKLTSEDETATRREFRNRPTKRGDKYVYEEGQ